MSAFGSGRVSLLYDEPGIGLSVTAQPKGGWFWCVYDRKAGAVRGFGKAPTAQTAVDAALRSLRAPQPVAAQQHHKQRFIASDLHADLVG